MILALIDQVSSTVVIRTFGEFSIAGRWLLFASLVLTAYPYYALLAKRLQDRGYSRVFAAVLLVVSLLDQVVRLLNPILLVEVTRVPVLGTVLILMGIAVSAWVFVELGFVRGTRVPNAYGPDPVG